MKRIQSSMKIFATLWLMLATVSAFAQNAKVSGVVSDENGEPLMGAAVIVKGTTTGTTTGLDGDFTLEYPQGATLTVSFIGYLEKDVVPGNRSHIEVSLEPDTKLLDEVVVIGYGTVKRKDLTGSVASVRGEDIEAKKTTTLSTALQGALSGVMVTRDNSAPGASAGSIRVRGITTIGTSDPLYIVISDIFIISKVALIFKVMDFVWMCFLVFLHHFTSLCLFWRTILTYNNIYVFIFCGINAFQHTFQLLRPIICWNTNGNKFLSHIIFLSVLFD